MWRDGRVQITEVETVSDVSHTSNTITCPNATESGGSSAQDVTVREKYWITKPAIFSTPKAEILDFL
jgi:hypothetical protein